MFLGSQVNLYADDVERVVHFYAKLGFVETYRHGPEGAPRHVEVKGPGLVLGIASPQAALEEHGLDVSQDGAAMEIVLWCEDLDAAYAAALEAGATVLREPHVFQDGRLRVAWVADPAGNPLELVQQLR
ncbi:VOC family protein [Puerhibacterium sp. TATVAM-FAB25]|uniref:VOC family protein n=1 Tax=Puerhibacterium sp. TATVAM-FAB25 TaxID=3093699 RepID=UPI00397B4741